MTLPRLYEIWHAWRKTPPLHIAFAGFVGALSHETKGPTKPAAAEGGGDLVHELARAGFAMSAGPLDARLKAMLDE